MLSEHRILLVSRAGILTLVAWDGLLASRTLWSKTGWRMYVSTIGLLRRHLISDGFDNIIRVFSLERSLGAQNQVG